MRRTEPCTSSWTVKTVPPMAACACGVHRYTETDSYRCPESTTDASVRYTWNCWTGSGQPAQPAENGFARPVAGSRASIAWYRAHAVEKSARLGSSLQNAAWFIV